MFLTSLKVRNMTTKTRIMAGRRPLTPTFLSYTRSVARLAIWNVMVVMSVAVIIRRCSTVSVPYQRQAPKDAQKHNVHMALSMNEI